MTLKVTWLVVWLVDWLAGRLVGWSAVWMVGVWINYINLLQSQTTQHKDLKIQKNKIKKKNQINNYKRFLIRIRYDFANALYYAIKTDFMVTQLLLSFFVFFSFLPIFIFVYLTNTHHDVYCKIHAIIIVIIICQKGVFTYICTYCTYI